LSVNHIADEQGKVITRQHFLMSGASSKGLSGSHRMKR
jgi:hypothetical protein